MPVEIRELVIRAVVADETSDEQYESTQAASDVDKDALIEECVKQVLKILRRNGER